MFRRRTGQTKEGQPAVKLHPSTHVHLNVVDVQPKSEVLFFLLPFRAEKELWIREKFVEKKFVGSSCSEGDGESQAACLAPPHHLFCLSTPR